MSKICKYAGDPTDEYCKNCNGITMEVDGNSIPCIECAGYEAGKEETDTNEEVMNPPVEETEDASVEETTNNVEKSVEEASKTKKSNNNTATNKNVKSTPKNKETINKKEDKAVKVKEEKKAVETTNDIKVVSMRYTSGATVKKGDNYFKFIAEEEWDVSQTEQNIDDVREQLWAKLNAEVDAQIEELNSIN
jgi:hypothetical protein|nr:MAG TPA: hypothetical protein [Caudoviricetes sp.]DAT10852.1 MAG TPA: hypothetical protein [Caudoviricetes sp.]